jgi:hypothetical protein
MSETHCIGDESLSEFFDRVDWDYIKRVIITKIVDGNFWAELIHYRSGKYMLHAFKHGQKQKDGVKE